MFKGLAKSKANIAAITGISCLLIGAALQPSVKAHGVETNFSGLGASGLLQFRPLVSL